MHRVPKIVGGFTLMLVAISAQSAEMAVLRNGFAIRHERHILVDKAMRLYFDKNGSGYVDIATEQIDRFEVAPSKSLALSSAAEGAASGTLRLKQLVNQASERHRIDADLINSVIHAESDFNPRARSPKGAQGLMQLMPQTALRLGAKDVYDPGTNVDAGTRYLRELLLSYHGNMAKALAAYNAGPQRVAQYRGVPPYRETHAYVARVIRDFNKKKLAQQKSLPPVTNP